MTTLVDLPSHLLVEILSRLPSSGDLSAARLSSGTLRSLSISVSSVSLRCSRRRSPLLLPFKTLALNNLSLLSSSSQTLTSLSVAVERIEDEDDGDEEEVEVDEDGDNLHLTAADFVARVVEIVGGSLRSLEIEDCWIQSCWRRTEALAIISDGCGSLLNLVLRNAWLSVEGLKPLPKLTTLTLEFIRLDDEHLDKVNECFPSLQVLNLISVGGLKEPKIHLSQLRALHWTVSNFPLSLSIRAPNLTKLKLQCVEPKVLFLETPLLSHLELKIRKPGRIVNIVRLSNLKFVLLESPYLCSLAKLLGNKSVERLELNVPESTESGEQSETVDIVDLVSAFSSVHDLSLGPGAWVKLEKSFGCHGTGSTCGWRNLKRLMIHLRPHYDFTFISFMLNQCVPFSNVILLMPSDVSLAATNHIISRCKTNFPKIIWKWGMWERSHKITWI